jgi:hypothetical protein
MVNELERSWYPDEAPAVDPVPATSASAEPRAKASSGTGAAAQNPGLPAWMTALLNHADTSAEARPAEDQTRSSLEASTPNLTGLLGELQKKSGERDPSTVPPSAATRERAEEPITLTAAVNLLPGEMSTAPAAKFLEAFRAYEKEKKRRDAERALREPLKRKPPG